MPLAPKKGKKSIFWEKCLENPKSMGAVAPSSPVLAKKMATYAYYETGQKIVELGAGTGALTKGLLTHGISPQDLISVELDESLVHVLRHQFPNVDIIHGNAVDLESVLPSQCVGKVDTIISSIPLMNFSLDQKKQIIDSCFKILKPKGRILQYTYGFMSPIPPKQFKVHAKRLAYVVFNLPPAFIWQFSKV